MLKKKKKKKKERKKEEELELNGKHKILVYVDDFVVLGENIQTIKKNKALLI
jgi:hypothetical protein